MGALRSSEAGRMTKAPGKIVALPYLGVAEVRGLHVGQRRWHAEDVHAQGSEAEDVCEGPADLLSRSPGLGLGSHVRCTRVRAIVTKVLPAANRTEPGTMPNAFNHFAGFWRTIPSRFRHRPGTNPTVSRPSGVSLFLKTPVSTFQGCG